MPHHREAVSATERLTRAKHAFLPLVIIFLGLFATLALPAYILVRPAYSRAALSKLRNGMTKTQVSETLGAPERICGTHEWEYSRWGNAGWVEVWFDEKGLVTGINDESVFPP